LGKDLQELALMPLEEYQLWAAYAGKKPLPLLKMDYMQAAIRATVVGCLDTSGKVIDLNDFMFKWSQVNEADYMTVEEINARNVFSACAMLGAPIEVIQKLIKEKEKSTDADS
jgi:DUF917 family protein